ncbi:T-lymphocyte activation antigen CD80 [Peromyscus californicus insignis]|uniref:T-lymphocyte activation antigen CD80 n=1 Tax=Peromyscus californicus insignis TaxID=564181 RepID=UPI0022A7FF86|nr:T-lymphocyte activation antigen CD80 [Peromyscus californicus insignis]
MGCQPRQDTSRPRYPHLRLAHLLVLMFGLFRTSSGIGHVSKSVKGVASLPCGYPFSPDELTRLRVYWQKDDKAVLSYTPGKTEVWSQYKNRTVLDIPSNFSLMILSLDLSDRGIYTCVIQRSDGGVHKRKHLASVKLSVRADYPVPNITELGNSSADIKRIMCLTSGGFPKPHLFWLENGKELSGINTTISQDPETELYTVSSKLDFNMTYNHSIVCHVVYGDSQVSKNFTWEKPPETPPGRNYLIEVTPTILTVLCLASAIILIIVYSICFRRRNEARRKENNGIYLGPVEASTEQNV